MEGTHKSNHAAQPTFHADGSESLWSQQGAQEQSDLLDNRPKTVRRLHGQIKHLLGGNWMHGELQGVTVEFNNETCEILFQCTSPPLLQKSQHGDSAVAQCDAARVIQAQTENQKEQK